jgi:hypothetical protein
MQQNTPRDSLSNYSEFSSVILGAACGYSVEQLNPFLTSLSSAAPKSQLVLFTNKKIDKSLYFGKTLSTGDMYFRNLLRKLPRGTRLASGLLLSVGRYTKSLLPFGEILCQAAFGVAIARYFWYRKWLEDNPGPPDQPILLTDTRDVVFQQDPFQKMRHNKMFCGAEPILLGKCGANSRWYETAYGKEALKSIEDKPVLCSGVIGGPRELVSKYLGIMCREICDIGHQILWSSGFDQALHNHLLRNTDIGNYFILEPWDGDRLTTMHYAMLSDFHLNEKDELTTKQGSIVSVVHQYDRHEALKHWVNRRWQAHP